ncbi:hypothetical protein GCM10011588_16990 [Nocardia jinanensis]|uniref:Uncharacterized protein n=1 Tax=Nocardia jinanensis TaxID=382504 RepID=A0A917RDW0_9NOCA|nr:hypothetical protein GCM10011588_16990 [Nocardia jinanensis]
MRNERKEDTGPPEARDNELLCRCATPRHRRIGTYPPSGVETGGCPPARVTARTWGLSGFVIRAGALSGRAVQPILGSERHRVCEFRAHRAFSDRPEMIR